MSQNLSSVAVVIGALRIKDILYIISYRIAYKLVYEKRMQERSDSVVEC